MERELTDEERKILADGQDIHDMMETPGWKKFVARLEAQIQVYLKELETEAPLEHVPFVRGKLQDLRWVLRVPDGFVTRRKEVLEKLEGNR